MGTQYVNLRVNGSTRRALIPSHHTLLQALRDLGYHDVKNGCEKGDCGACAVLLDGKPVNSCMVFAWEADGREVVTNSGLGTLDSPHPLQAAFVDTGAVQCGFCSGGLIIAAKSLLERNPIPTESEIREALSGNLCRCGGYGQIVKAIQIAGDKLRSLPSGGGAP